MAVAFPTAPPRKLAQRCEGDSAVQASKTARDEIGTTCARRGVLANMASFRWEVRTISSNHASCNSKDALDIDSQRTELQSAETKWQYTRREDGISDVGMAVA